MNREHRPPRTTVGLPPAQIVARLGAPTPHVCQPGTTPIVEPGTTSQVGLVLIDSIRAGDVWRCGCGHEWLAVNRRGLLVWRRFRRRR